MQTETARLAVNEDMAVHMQARRGKALLVARAWAASEMSSGAKLLLGWAI